MLVTLSNEPTTLNGNGKRVSVRKKAKFPSVPINLDLMLSTAIKISSTTTRSKEPAISKKLSSTSSSKIVDGETQTQIAKDSMASLRLSRPIWRILPARSKGKRKAQIRKSSNQ